MSEFNPQYAAQNMIYRHGLRAEALAMEHLSERRHTGDSAGLVHWQAVHAAIRELRRTQLAAEQNSRLLARV